ncbi:hypothetical protein [Streptomyces pyxinae]|uniref:hypothetical protein n=1 Tax=Streptomyces pyxinae TaxID=2970734 RepID=UPI0028681187|nr:hypothetical protein [Streptomyces sp. LP05-1]
MAHTGPAPDWCPWFTPAEWAAFREALASVFRDAGPGIAGGGAGPGEERFVHLGRADGHHVPLDLGRLAAEIRPLPRWEWPAALLRLTAEAERGLAALDVFGGLAPDDVPALLLPRLRRPDDIPDGVVHGTLTDELSVLVFVRVGDRAHPLPAERAERWGMTPEAALRRALANLHHDPVALGHDGDRAMVNAESPAGFTSAHLLRVPELLTTPAPHGILAMVPYEGSLFFTALNAGEPRWQLIGCAETVEKHWAEQPPERRLCSRVLWMYEGSVESIGVTPAPPGSSAPGVVTGSERFLAVLSRLSPDGIVFD